MSDKIYKKCGECGGRGGEHVRNFYQSTYWQDCDKCNGKGFVEVDPKELEGEFPALEQTE